MTQYKDMKMTMTDISTGRKIESCISDIRQINDMTETIVTPQASFNLSSEFTYKADVDISPDIISILLGNPNENKSKFELQYKGNVLEKVQLRKHKKTRVNKKWAKKYGYKEILVPCSYNKAFEDLTMEENEDGNYELQGKLSL